MSRIKTHVKMNDLVEVTAGAYKGAQRKIIEVQAGKGRVLVEGVRMIKKCVKPSQERQEGGIIETEGPIHISNVRKTEEKPKPKKKAAAKKKVAKAK